MTQNLLRVSFDYFLPKFKAKFCDIIFFILETSLKLLDDTMCTADMKQPLGSSTPTDVLDNKENMNDLPDLISNVDVPIDDKEPKTPVSEFNR